MTNVSPFSYQPVRFDTPAAPVIEEAAPKLSEAVEAATPPAIEPAESAPAYVSTIELPIRETNEEVAPPVASIAPEPAPAPAPPAPAAAAPAAESAAAQVRSFVSRFEQVETRFPPPPAEAHEDEVAIAEPIPTPVIAPIDESSEAPATPFEQVETRRDS